MERKAFELLNEMERSWWYRARARVIRIAMKKTGVNAAGDMLDFGAGFGGMYESLKGFSARVYAFEPDAEADKAARARGYTAVYATDTEALTPERYDTIGAFDVVEHIEHDVAFLKNAYASLKPGGHIVITVPAFPFLWSVHDVNHHHFRRYTTASMRAALHEAGFTVTYASYWNMFLFVPAALMRLLGRSGEGALALPFWLDSIFYAVLTVENMLMQFASLPFGVSLVVVGRKV